MQPKLAAVQLYETAVQPYETAVQPYAILQTDSTIRQIMPAVTLHVTDSHQVMVNYDHRHVTDTCHYDHLTSDHPVSRQPVWHQPIAVSKCREENALSTLLEGKNSLIKPSSKRKRETGKCSRNRNNKKSKLVTPALAKLDTPAVAKLDTPAVAKLDTPAVAKLDTPAVAKLDTPAVAKLDTPAVAKLDTPAVAKLATPAVAKLDTPNVAKLDTPNVAKLDTPAVAKLDTPAVAKLDTPAVAKLDTPAVAKLDTPALAKLDTPNVAKLDIPALAKLDTPAVAKLDTPAVAKLDTPDVAELDTPAVAKLDTPDVAKLDTPAVAKLATPSTETDVSFIKVQSCARSSHSNNLTLRSWSKVELAKKLSNKIKKTTQTLELFQTRPPNAGLYSSKSSESEKLNICEDFQAETCESVSATQQKVWSSTHVSSVSCKRHLPPKKRLSLDVNTTPGSQSANGLQLHPGAITLPMKSSKTHKNSGSDMKNSPQARRMEKLLEKLHHTKTSLL
ncbi:neurofilament heavy polypeptide-like [Physella acuta]|uniref:neurofilament heavy polypeptide-like n=1 Tax=Physella acuta TaxID=109671 RepID=UPI0027DB041E|nr:neurofilament heavy polypeptide-like [Physella acuta]